MPTTPTSHHHHHRESSHAYPPFNFRFAFQGVLEELLKEHHPKLYHHFRQLGVLTMISLPWFITCYLSAMPFQSAVHILDCFFYDGARVLMQVALTILSEAAVALLDSSDDCMAMAQLSQFLQGIYTVENIDHLKSEKTISVTALLQMAYDKYSFINNELVIEKRQQVMVRVVQTIQDNISKTAVRSAVDESLFADSELAALHRVFYDGCMKVCPQELLYSLCFGCKCYRRLAYRPCFDSLLYPFLILAM